VVNHELEHRLTRALRAGRTQVQPAPSPARNSALPARVVVMAAPAEVAETTIGNKTPVQKKRATIGKRTKVDADLSDSTCTPKWLADLLPRRKLDPCSNPRSHVRADVEWSLENGNDGLSAAWLEDAFINWPFSGPLPWAQKAQHEMKIGNTIDLIVLCKLDPSTRSWKEITTRVPGLVLDLWMPDERIQFDEHPELIERRRLEKIAKAEREGKKQKQIDNITGESTANFVSVLLHHRLEGSQPWRKFATFAKRWVQP
jgi:hypothetical protein